MMTLVKVNLYKFTKTTAIVIARCLCIAKRLHDGTRGEHFLLDLRLFGRATHVGKVAHRIFSADCFARARLTRHYDRLVLLEVNHFLKGLLRHGKYMRIHVLHVTSIVHLYYLIAVNGQLFVGIYGDENDATVGVNLIAIEKAHFQIVQHFGLVEVAQCGQIVLTNQNVGIAERR